MGEHIEDAGVEARRSLPPARLLIGWRLWAGSGRSPLGPRWHAAAHDTELLPVGTRAAVEDLLRQGSYAAARAEIMASPAAAALTRIEGVMTGLGYADPWAVIAAAWDRTLPAG